MAEKLHSPEQLPDIAGRKLVFAWDQEGADSIVSYAGAVVWRERTGWEVYGRFVEIAVILQRKYGARIKDLVPTPTSEWALYGDSSAASPRVQSIRARLASGKPKKYSYWELEKAGKANDVDGLRLYLLAGGHPSATNPNDGTTLLHVAARFHLPDIVRLLVDAGAKLNALDRGGASPLREALYRQSLNPEAAPPEAADRKSQTLEIVKLLVDAGANTDGLNRPQSKLNRIGASLYTPPLVLAAQAGDLEVARYLLERGASVDLAARGESSALHVAVLYGQLDVVRLLVGGGADVNRPDPPDAVTPLLRAICPLLHAERAAEMIRLLVQAGARLEGSDAAGETPLLFAIFNGKVDLVSLLLSLGADVHRRDPEGNSTLARAVLAARPYPTERIVSMIHTLRAAGADSAVRNKEGKSARDLARESGLSTLEALL